MRIYHIEKLESVYNPETDSNSWDTEMLNIQATRHELNDRDNLRLFMGDEVIAEFGRPAFVSWWYTEMKETFEES